MSALGSEEIAGLGFEQMVRSAPVAIAVIEASGRVIFTNPRARELNSWQLGHEVPTDLGGATDIFHPDGRRYDREEWPAVRSLTSGEEIVDEEFFYALPDGTRLFVRCSCSPVRDKGGAIIAAVLAMGDVTEQKRQEERLRYLAGLLDNTEDAVIALDAQWFITAWNAGAEGMYGWKADEVLGRHTLEFARLEMSHEERAEFRLAAAQHGRSRAELIAHRKDGTPVWVELITVALRDSQGEITGYLGIHRDVGERRRVMEELRESRQRVETILESISDAFITVDRDWRYTYVNDRGRRRMEAWRGRAFTREEIIGQSMWELFPDALGTELEQRLRAAMDAREPNEFELYFAPTGQWVEARTYSSPDGLSVYYRNVSERRRAERALRESEEQRAAADRRLESVREAERRRIARDLHDGALQGLAHALALTDLHATRDRDDLAAILKQVGRQVRAAIYDLRIEANGERGFSEAIRELVEVNREAIPGCEVTLEADDDLPAGLAGARATEVLRIVGEAIANACRHAAAEHIFVRVAGTATGLSIEVADDGRGFDPSRQPPAPQGQGLRGMQERAELVGGQLHVRSDRAGTTVRLEITLSG
jgi:PAS domain S-box-containing protein